MDIIMVLPIIFLVLLLTMGIVLSTNELISKNTTADNVAQTNNNSPSVDIDDTNKILRGNFMTILQGLIIHLSIYFNLNLNILYQYYQVKVFDF